MKTRVFLLVAILIALFLTPLIAAAHPCGDAKQPCDTVLRNPDSRPSITVTGSTGSLEGMQAGRDADLSGLGVAFVYPVGCDLSLLAGYSYADGEWNGIAPRCGPLDNWKASTFTVGFRFYLGG
jgi:hypothetical protein